MQLSGRLARVHINSALAFEKFAAPLVPADAHVLEIGPDGHPSTYRRAVQVPVTWVTADLADQAGTWATDRTSAEIRMPSEYELPVEDETFDAVVSGNVIEHVRQPWRWMAELARVTKPGGLVMTVAPVTWVYHPAPIDCYRYYPDGLDAICEFAGLKPEVSWWGALEPRQYKRTYPGVGLEWYDWQRYPRVKKALARVGLWQVPIAYDIVSVARKPAS